MLKHLYLILIATFILGFIVGVVVFLQNNTGKDGDGSIVTTGAKGLSILAYTYGGCSRGGGCPSYRVANNGSYTYITRDRVRGEVKYEDTLTKKQFESLKTQVSETNFDRIDDSEFRGNCATEFDGIAYRYDIEYKGERYEVDSCIEDVSAEALFVTLQGYFDIFDLTYREE